MELMTAIFYTVLVLIAVVILVILVNYKGKIKPSSLVYFVSNEGVFEGMVMDVDINQSPRLGTVVITKIPIKKPNTDLSVGRVLYGIPVTHMMLVRKAPDQLVDQFPADEPKGGYR